MQSTRLFEILYLLLLRDDVTVKQLAEKLEVSERTVRRDVDALSAAGIPVYTARGRGGGVRLLPGFVLSKTLLSTREQDEILTALQSLKATGTGVESEVLTHLSGIFCRGAADWIDVDFSPWGGDAEAVSLFPNLKNAIIERRIVEFDYFASNGQSSHRTVEPYRLCFKKSNWYLQAYCCDRADFRTFRLSRIEHLKVDDQQFTQYHEPPVLSQQFEEMELTFLPVVLRFSSKLAYRVYDQFRRGEIEKQSDGTLLVRTVWPQGDWSVEYLLSFGAFVEVLEPPELREVMKQQAQHIFQKYL